MFIGGTIHLAENIWNKRLHESPNWNYLKDLFKNLGDLFREQGDIEAYSAQPFMRSAALWGEREGGFNSVAVYISSLGLPCYATG